MIHVTWYCKPNKLHFTLGCFFRGYFITASEIRLGREKKEERNGRKDGAEGGEGEEVEGGRGEERRIAMV